MESLLIELNKNERKPVFSLGVGNQLELLCLFDTGADIPVFTLGSEMLMFYFPNAEEIAGLCVVLNGFGRECEVVPVYKIPNFKIVGYNGAVIEYTSLYVACTMRKDIGAQLVMSATMFNQMNYTILNIGVDSPRLEIEYNDRLYCTGIKRIVGNEKEIEEFRKKYGGVPVNVVYSFTQSDTSTILDPVSQMEAEMKQALAEVDKKFEC